jgi:hypothetical protein
MPPLPRLSTENWLNENWLNRGGAMPGGFE